MSAIRFTLRGLASTDGLSPRQRYVQTLTEYLQPNSTTRTEAAAKSIDTLSPLKQEDGEPSSTEDFVWGFWDDIDQIARQIPHNHAAQDKLVDVIRELKALPPTTITVWGNEQRLWTDLPLAGPVFRDAWVGPQEGDKSSQDQWVNKNAFFARLFGTRTVSWKPNFAVWTMRDALESSAGQPKKLRECYVSAATTWIEYAGKYLYEWTLNGESDEEFVNVTSSGELFSGSAGLNSERWTFWKTRFESLSSELETEESTNRAREAAKQMAAIDGSS